MTVTEVDTSNPYPGPEAFHYRQSMFGRTEDAELLFSQLVAERIVLLYSPSGAGKTSIIRAMVRPLLEDDGFFVLPEIRVGHELPPELQQRVPNRYLASAIASLEEGLEEEGRSLQVTEHIGTTLSAACEGAGSGECVVVFDQFEELVIKDLHDTRAKFEFMQEVGEALRDRSIWALFSMREDYIAALDPYLHLIPTRLTSGYRLDFLTRAGARLAISRPAAAFNRPFENGDADLDEEADDPVGKIIEDLEGEAARTGYIEPLHLQVVCRQLWSGLEEGPTITMADVETLGSVDDALGTFIDDEITKLEARCDLNERNLRDWFETELVDGSFRRQTLNGPEGPAETNDQLIRDLLDTRLVRTFSRGHTLWLELAHDRLVEPLKASNNRWRGSHLLPFQRSAAAWDSSGRPPSALLTGGNLRRARAKSKQADITLSRVEEKFLEESKRRNRMLLAGIIVGFLILALAISGAGVMNWFRADAEGARATAVAEQERAEKANDLLLTSLGRTQELLNEAEESEQRAEESAEAAQESAEAAQEAQTRAEAERLAAVAGRTVTTDINLSTLMGLAATELTRDLPGQDTINPRASVYEALQGTRIETVLRGSDTPGLAYVPLSASEDGPMVLTIEASGEVAAWDALTGEATVIAQVEPDGRFTNLALSPDGSLVALSSDTGIAWVVAADGTSIDSRDLGPSPITDAAFSADGSSLIFVQADGSVREWVLGSGMAHVLLGMGNGARGIAVASDGSGIAVATTSGEPVFIDSDQVGIDLPAVDHVDGETRLGIAYSPDGRLVAAGAANGTVRLWDADTGTEAGTLLRDTDVGDLPAHDGAVTAIIFTADGSSVVTAGADGTAVVWDLATLEENATLHPHIGGVVALAADPGGDSIALAAESGWSSIWSVAPAHGRAIRDLAYDPTGRYVASASHDGTVRLWSDEGELIAVFDDDGGIVWDVDFSSDGRLLASVSSDGVAIVREVPGGAPAARFEGHDGSAFGVAFSPTEPVLATSDASGTIRIWELTSTTPQTTIAAHETAANAVAFSPDGATLASGSDDTTIKLWDVASGELERTIGDHENSVVSLAFSPDGSMLASGGFDRKARIYDTDTGEAIHTFADFSAPVYEVAFSPGSEFLAVTSAEQTHGARVFRVDELRDDWSEMTRIPHLEVPYALAYSPDGNTLVTGGVGHLPFFNPLERAALVEAAEARLTRDPRPYCFRYSILCADSTSVSDQ